LHLAHDDLKHLGVYGVRGAESPYVDIAGKTFDEYYKAQCSGKTRSRDRGHVKEAREQGFELIVETNPPSLKSSIEQMMDVEDLSWKKEAGSSMKSDPRVRSFVFDLAKRFAPRGELVATRLGNAERTVAFVLGFVKGDGFYYYKTSFDPALEEMRPGRIVTNRTIEEACARKLQRFDFLGAADEYKLRYTDKTRPHATVFLYNGGFRSRMQRLIKRSAVPLAKKLFSVGQEYEVRIDRRGGLR
jgi:CelD/BcsL family acetyltransferase involved in cellulose biosynthesis